MARSDLRPEPLSHDRILDAAVAVLDDGGPSALTMRRLAARLDVTPMAVYKWYAGRDELIDALTARAVAAVEPPAASTGTWAERTTALAVGIRSVLLDHLSLLQLEGAPRRLVPMIARTADHALALMLELGHDEDGAVAAYRVLFWSVIDFCLVIDATDAMPAVSSDRLAERFSDVGFGTDPEQTPTLAALLPRFGTVDRDEFFLQTVQTVVAGLEALAPRR